MTALREDQGLLDIPEPCKEPVEPDVAFGFPGACPMLQIERRSCIFLEIRRT